MGNVKWTTKTFKRKRRELEYLCQAYAVDVGSIQDFMEFMISHDAVDGGQNDPSKMIAYFFSRQKIFEIITKKSLK